MVLSGCLGSRWEERCWYRRHTAEDGPCAALSGIQSAEGIRLVRFMSGGEIGSHATPGSGRLCVCVEERSGDLAMEGYRAVWIVPTGTWLSCLKAKGYPRLKGVQQSGEELGDSHSYHSSTAFLLLHMSEP